VMGLRLRWAMGLNVASGSGVVWSCVLMIVDVRWENWARTKGKIDYRLEKFDTDDEASGVLGGFTSGVRSIY